MGTVLEATVIANDDARARQLAERSLAVAQRWEQVLTTWRDDGELAKLNVHAGQGPSRISPDLSSALERMLALETETLGAFDPAVGSIVRALRDGQGIPALQSQETYRFHDVVRLGHGTAALLLGVQLDAGGIGKGIALDAVSAMLEREHADAWFLNFGGSSQTAHGRPESGREWIIGIAALKPGHVLGTLALNNGSLSTSRAVPAYEVSGTIVDPGSGAPVISPRMATVLASDATSADAWSTALVVLGREGLDAAHSKGVEVLFEDEAGVICTPGFPLDRGPAPRIRVPSVRPYSQR
jgi:thiamine biosynthesis lipoprotein